MRARAVWFDGPRRVAIRPVDVRTDASEVLVRTTRSGISAGTELLAYRGEIDPDTPLDETIGALAGTFAYPFRYGYSCVGRVARGGGGIAEGERVFVFHPHQDLVSVPAGDVIAVPDVPDRIATMLPLVETALQIRLDADVRGPETVVVTGLGVVGLLTSLLLQRDGADVVAVDPRVDRRKAAADVGVAAIDPADASAAVMSRTDERGAPLLVEASGSPAALGSSLALLAHEGTALVAGWYGRVPVALPLGGAFHRRRLTIRSTQVSTIPAAASARWTRERRLRVARDLLGRLPLERLATHEIPFEEAATAYDALDRGEPGLVHAALTYA